MSKVNVLVLEDQKIESDALVVVLNRNGYNMSAVARTHKEALESLKSKPIDILIIDVFIDGNPDGILLAETVSNIASLSKPFVFLTSSKDRSIFERAKLTKPFAFLMKPFNELEVLYALEMAMEKFYEQVESFDAQDNNTVLTKDHIFIKKKGVLIKVKIQEITYIEVEDRYCNILTSSDKFVVLISLKRMERLLSEFGFLRTHRNFIVNRSKIDKIILSEDSVILEDGQTIPLSENYRGIIKDIDILS